MGYNPDRKLEREFTKEVPRIAILVINALTQAMLEVPGLIPRIEDTFSFEDNLIGYYNNGGHLGMITADMAHEENIENLLKEYGVKYVKTAIMDPSLKTEKVHNCYIIKENDVETAVLIKEIVDRQYEEELEKFLKDQELEEDLEDEFELEVETGEKDDEKLEIEASQKIEEPKETIPEVPTDASRFAGKPRIKAVPKKKAEAVIAGRLGMEVVSATLYEGEEQRSYSETPAYGNNEHKEAEAYQAPSYTAEYDRSEEIYGDGGPQPLKNDLYADREESEENAYKHDERDNTAASDDAGLIKSEPPKNAEAMAEERSGKEATSTAFYEGEQQGRYGETSTYMGDGYKEGGVYQTPSYTDAHGSAEDGHLISGNRETLKKDLYGDTGKSNWSAYRQGEMYASVASNDIDRLKTELDERGISYREITGEAKEVFRSNLNGGEQTQYKEGRAYLYISETPVQELKEIKRVLKEEGIASGFNRETIPYAENIKSSIRATSGELQGTLIDMANTRRSFKSHVFEKDAESSYVYKNVKATLYHSAENLVTDQSSLGKALDKVGRVVVKELLVDSTLKNFSEYTTYKYQIKPLIDPVTRIVKDSVIQSAAKSSYYVTKVLEANSSEYINKSFKKLSSLCQGDLEKEIKGNLSLRTALKNVGNINISHMSCDEIKELIKMTRQSGGPESLASNLESLLNIKMRQGGNDAPLEILYSRHELSRRGMKEYFRNVISGVDRRVDIKAIEKIIGRRIPTGKLSSLSVDELLKLAKELEKKGASKELINDIKMMVRAKEGLGFSSRIKGSLFKFLKSYASSYINIAFRQSIAFEGYTVMKTVVSTSASVIRATRKIANKAGRAIAKHLPNTIAGKTLAKHYERKAKIAKKKANLKEAAGENVRKVIRTTLNKTQVGKSLLERRSLAKKRAADRLKKAGSGAISKISGFLKNIFRALGKAFKYVKYALIILLIIILIWDILKSKSSNNSSAAILTAGYVTSDGSNYNPKSATGTEDGENKSLAQEIVGELENLNTGFITKINLARVNRSLFKMTAGYGTQDLDDVHETTSYEEGYYDVQFYDFNNPENEIENTSCDLNNSKAILSLANVYYPEGLAGDASTETREQFRRYCLTLWNATHRIAIEEYRPDFADQETGKCDNDQQEEVIQTGLSGTYTMPEKLCSHGEWKQVGKESRYESREVTYKDANGDEQSRTETYLAGYDITVRYYCYKHIGTHVSVYVGNLSYRPGTTKNINDTLGDKPSEAETDEESLAFEDIIDNGREQLAMMAENTTGAMDAFPYMIAYADELSEEYPLEIYKNGELLNTEYYKNGDYFYIPKKSDYTNVPNDYTWKMTDSTGTKIVQQGTRHKMTSAVTLTLVGAGEAELVFYDSEGYVFEEMHNIPYGSKINMPEGPDDAPEGKVFRHWRGDSKTYLPGAEYTVKAGSTYYDFYPEYKNDEDAEEGTGKKVTVTLYDEDYNVMETVTIPKGSTYTVPKVSDYTNGGAAGYWTREDNDDYVLIKEGTKITVSKNISLYLTYSEDAVAKFYSFGGDLLGEKTISTGGTIRMPGKSQSIMGYRFLGWAYNGKVYRKGATVTLQEGGDHEFNEEFEEDENYIDEEEDSFFSDMENQEYDEEEDEEENTGSSAKANQLVNDMEKAGGRGYRVFLDDSPLRRTAVNSKTVTTSIKEDDKLSDEEEGIYQDDNIFFMDPIGNSVMLYNGKVDEARIEDRLSSYYGESWAALQADLDYNYDEFLETEIKRLQTVSSSKHWSGWADSYTDSCGHIVNKSGETNRTLARAVYSTDWSELYGITFNRQYYSENGWGDYADITLFGLEGLNSSQILVCSKIFSELVAYGFSPAMAAGACGNVWQESHFEPAAGAGKSAYGIIQWMGTRKNRLLTYASNKGVLWTDIDLQIEFLIKELTGEIGGYSYIDAMNSYLSLNYSGATVYNIDDVEGAANAWCARVEGCVCGGGKNDGKAHDASNCGYIKGISHDTYQHIRSRRTYAQDVYGSFSNSGATGIRALIISTADRYRSDINSIKVTYTMGGKALGPADDPNMYGGVDCSGFIHAIYAFCGISVPSYSQDFANVGKEVSIDEAQPGDIVVYGPNSNGVGHVAIYAGNNTIIHIGGSAGVVKTSPYNYRTNGGVKCIVNVLGD